MNFVNWLIGLQQVESMKSFIYSICEYSLVSWSFATCNKLLWIILILLQVFGVLIFGKTPALQSTYIWGLRLL